MKQFVRRILGSVTPSVLEWIQAYRFRRHCKKTFLQFQNELAHSLYSDGSIHVLSGPFKGMRYFNEIVWGPIAPKWIGSYEEELHEVFLKEIFEKSYRNVVDVGAAEGYYAVGLAKALPRAHVYAFDIDPFARQLQLKLSQLNGIQNITIGKRCTHRELDDLLLQGGLVICDIEGFETDLIDPVESPNLVQSDILVELHDFDDQTVEQTREIIGARFSESHYARLVKRKERNPADYEQVCGHLLDQDTLVAALDEHRSSKQEWLWLMAR